MRRLASTFAAALLVASYASTAAPAQTSFPAPSVKLIRDDDGSIAYERIRNTTVRTLPYFADGRHDAMLLVVEEDLWMEAGEMRDTVRVRALGEEKGGAFTRPLWARAEGADGWDLLTAGYLRLTTISCCGTVTTHTLYDLETGREVAWHTEAPLMAIDLRARSVLVLYESARSLRAPPGAHGQGDDDDVQGMLRIVRGTEVTDQVLVAGRDPGTDGLHPRLRAAFCDAAGRPTLQQLSGGDDDISFNACFEMQGRQWILLPVHGGRFVLENARLPAGITVRRGGW